MTDGREGNQRGIERKMVTFGREGDISQVPGDNIS